LVVVRIPLGLPKHVGLGAVPLATVERVENRLGRWVRAAALHRHDPVHTGSVRVVVTRDVQHVRCVTFRDGWPAAASNPSSRCSAAVLVEPVADSANERHVVRLLCLREVRVPVHEVHASAHTPLVHNG
jgi:hypothetical protein